VSIVLSYFFIKKIIKKQVDLQNCQRGGCYGFLRGKLYHTLFLSLPFTKVLLVSYTDNEREWKNQKWKPVHFILGALIKIIDAGYGWI
jgi:hypothetical protein